MRAGREGAGRGARAFFPFFAAALATTGLEDGVARPDRLLGDVVPQYPPLRPSSAGDLAGVRFGDFDARFGGILFRSVRHAALEETVSAAAFERELCWGVTKEALPSTMIPSSLEPAWIT